MSSSYTPSPPWCLHGGNRTALIFVIHFSASVSLMRVSFVENMDKGETTHMRASQKTREE
jgi:hypothetical protein